MACFSALPDTATLQGQLAVALDRSAVRVIERRHNHYSTTAPSEIAHLELDDGVALRAFLKYESGASDATHSHRGGVPYEATVNKILLQPLGVSVPRFYGFHAEESVPFLVTEYMAASISVNKSNDRTAMTKAAEWIGDFHARGERFLAHPGLSTLKRYDYGYYSGWSRRAERQTANAGIHDHWLQATHAGFRESVKLLLGSGLSPIHGEYYPHNILVHEGRIRPIDWESAAIAAGEIDIAALTEKWPTETLEECLSAYDAVRWPGGPPEAWERRLGLAQLYLHFRSIAADARRRPLDRSSWRLRAVRSIGERLGFARR